MKHYVYSLFRPDGSPCYIGLGSGGRWKKHFSGTHNPRLASIISRAGGELPALILCRDLTLAQASEYERAFIAAIGRSNKGPLVNMTDGGEGTLGYKRTEAEKLAIGKMVRDRKWTDADRLRAAERQKGQLRSTETRQKMREAALNRPPISETTRAKMRESARTKVFSPEHRAKANAALTRPKSEAHKAKLRALCIARNTKAIALGNDEGF